MVGEVCRLRTLFSTCQRDIRIVVWKFTFSVELMLKLSIAIQAKTSNVAINRDYYVLTQQNEKKPNSSHSALFLCIVSNTYLRDIITISLYVGYFDCTKSPTYFLFSFLLSSKQLSYAEDRPA